MKKHLLIPFLIFIFPLTGNAQCTTTNATSCVCATSGSATCDLLPDIIVARPPLLVSGTNGIIEYSQSGNGSNNGRLRISVSTPNIGHGPLEVRTTNTYICGTDTIIGTAPATCPNTGLPPRQLVKQRVYHKDGNSMTYYDRDAGSMTYHPTHGHMHVDDWGVYTLRTQTTDPNPLNWPIIGTGAKLAFCLMDYGSCSTYNGHCVDSLGNTLTNGNFPNYGLGGGGYNCSSVVQGISSGYTDIYYQYLDGMYIDIPPGTCNGDYYIVVQLDPYDYFLEENENNNVIAVPFTLTQQVPSANATITSNGTSNNCTNPGVTLTANQGAGYTYLWSTGETTSSIVVNTPGSYSVSVTTPCGVATSSPFPVTFIDIAPQTTHDEVCGQGSGILTANAGGGIVDWFDVPSGGSSLHTGNVFNTPVVSTTTTYFAQATTTTPGFSGYNQPNDNTFGGGGYLTSSQYLIFNALSTFTLTSVKVYAQSATNTTVELRSSTGTLINSQAVSLPSGESRITLNWNIPAGSSYRLTRSGSAALYRNNAGVSYPYTLPGYVSITGSSAGSGFYYFFYDWEVNVPSVTCVSDRSPATVTVYANPTVTFAALSEVCHNAPAFLLTGGAPSGGNYSGAGVNSNNFDPAVAGIGIHTITYSYTDGNGCSASATQNITVKNCGCNPPGMPGSIQGLARVCTGSTLSYQVNNNPNVTSYNWVAPQGAQIVSGQGTHAITLQFGPTFTSGDLCVYANNACGPSVPRCKTLTKHVAQRPGAFIGELNGHCETANGTLSVTPVNYALSYDWTVPAGVNITSGQGTTTITFTTDPGFSSGQVCVVSNNGCMTSTPRCANMFAAPARPTISGPTSVCANQTGVAYSVNPSYGATVYNWFVPAGATIVSGQGTTNVVVDFGTSGGQVRCTAKNACGKRGQARLNVDITCREGEVQSLPVSVYPNPANEYFDVVFEVSENTTTRLELMDISGRMVFVDEKQSVEGENEYRINVKSFSKGIYLLNIITNTTVNRTRVVID
jgi:hypothetical protein